MSQRSYVRTLDQPKMSIGFVLRGWPVFLDAKEFSVPKPEVIQERISTNILYYQANYALIASLFLCYVCVAKPIMFILIPCMIAAAVYLLSKQPPFEIGKYRFSKHQAIIIYLGVCITLALLIAGSSFVVAMSMATLRIHVDCNKLIIYSYCLSCTV